MPFCGLRFSVKIQPPVFPRELETLGDHIRARRLNQNLKQKDVAQFVGVDPFTILNWEKNKTEPGARYYPKIVEFLGYCPIRYAHSFGELLRFHRTHKGLSHRKLGKILGFDPASVSRWESSERKPYRKWKNRLMSFFGMHQNFRIFPPPFQNS